MSRIKAAALAVVMLLCTVFMCVPASAESYNAILIDDVDFLTQSQKAEVLTNMTEAAEKAQCNIALIISDTISGLSEREYTEKFLDDNFGITSDSVVFYFAANLHFDHDDWLSCSGSCDKKIGENSNVLIKKVYDGLEESGWKGAADAYVSGILELMGVQEGGEPPADEPKFRVILRDEQDVLTDAEETELLVDMQSAADKIECSVAVVITDNILGKTARRYADDFLDENFGFGSSAIVFLFNNDLVSDYDYDSWISTCGRANDLYEYNTDPIFDAVWDKVDATGSYADGIKAFCRYLRSHSSGAIGNTVYDPVTDYQDGTEKAALIGVLLVPPAIVALIISLCVTAAESKKYRKKSPISAAKYLDESRTRLITNYDIFMREYTTHYTKSSSSGGGGHHSGGGGHHSGGHSHHGGGGHHR